MKDVTEGSIKTLSLHPRVCSDFFLFSQSQLQQHIPSLSYWTENYSLCLLPWESLLGIQQKLPLLPASSFLHRVLLRVLASQRATQLLSQKKHCKVYDCWLLLYPINWCEQAVILLMCAGTRVVQQQISVLRRCHKPPKSPYTVLEGGLVMVNPEAMCRGDTRSH